MPEITSRMEHFRSTEWHSVLHVDEEESINISGRMECEARMHENPEERCMLLVCHFDLHGEDPEVFSIHGVAEVYFSLSERDDEKMESVLREQCIPVAQKELEKRITAITADLGFSPVTLGQ